MSFEKNDVLASLFANAIRSPQPSTSSAAASPAARPSLAHSKSIGAAEPSTPRRPQTGGKRVPRRSTTSFSYGATTPITLFPSHNHHSARKSAGSVSPQSSHHHQHGSASPFAGAKFTDSPSARAIPLPPTVWFEQEDNDSPCPSSDTESISSFTTSSSSSSSDSLPLGPESEGLSPSAALSARFAGVRVTPLQLIAAVSAQ